MKSSFMSGRRASAQPLRLLRNLPLRRDLHDLLHVIGCYVSDGGNDTGTTELHDVVGKGIIS